MSRPLVLALSLGLAAALPASAQVPEMPNLPPNWEVPMTAPLPEGQTALDPAALDISGAWIYTSTNHVVLSCDFPAPPGPDMSGHMEIAEIGGGAVSLTLVTGATCSPDTMCIFDGAIVGNVLNVANSATVDNEGGVASNGLSLIFTAPDRGLGSGVSSYVHPEGYRCNWGYSVTLRRPVPGEVY